MYFNERTFHHTVWRSDTCEHAAGDGGAAGTGGGGVGVVC